jgi:hypothetical protein
MSTLVTTREPTEATTKTDVKELVFAPEERAALFLAETAARAFRTPSFVLELPLLTRRTADASTEPASEEELTKQEATPQNKKNNGPKERMTTKAEQRTKQAYHEGKGRATKREEKAKPPGNPDP